MSRELMGGTWNKEDLERMKLESRIKKYKNERKNFILRRIIKPLVIAGGSLTTAGATFGLVVGSTEYRKANYKQDSEDVKYYEEQNYLAAKADGKDYSGYEEIMRYHKKIDELEKSIELSENLHELKLNKKNMELSSDDGTVYTEPGYVYSLIEEYNLNPTVEVAAELSEIEKQVNSDIYAGYKILEDYGLATAKTYLADLYGGNEKDYHVKLNDVQHDGYKKIIGPGYKELEGVDNDVYDYINVLNFVHKKHGVTDDPKTTEYNEARNDAIKEAIKKYNTEGADILKDIERKQKKELKESQERTEKYFENFGKSK